MSRGDASGCPKPTHPTDVDKHRSITAWHYRMLMPGVFEWTSPHGHHYLRDHTGTTPIDEPRPPDRP